MKNSINIDEVINKATKNAIKEYDKEKRMEQRKKIFHNTKLLLKHYNDLKSHVQNAIADIKQLEGDLDELGDLERDELYILSIKKSKSKTLIMIAHIDMAMDLLKKRQYKLCSIEKYHALEKYYFKEMTFEEVAESLNCGVVTARRWINEMINELSILLFGIDGMKLDMI
ncbi:hypothetical protein DP145_06810 [Clostridium tetani]|nr:hypothetical protein DP126_05015 [Clostridium tetani]RXM61832.1 hypothetical protein DP138_03030 [Clostridium tetani]RXM67748.1 hypothetical protein DP145_06810 [Clostridium tetani]